MIEVYREEKEVSKNAGDFRGSAGLTATHLDCRNCTGAFRYRRQAGSASHANGGERYCLR